jgi:hypothetical protein
MNSRCSQSLRLLVPVILIAFVSVAWASKAPEVPAGTVIHVRMIDKLSSEESQNGDIFHGTLEEPITVDGKDLYPKGADVAGRVTDVHKTGRISEPGELDLILTTVTAGNLTSSLHVEPLVIKGESHQKSNVTKIGGGAALGAVIGAIAGGGKGAAIGTLAGGAAGTGAAAATGKRPALVESEAVLDFTTVAASATSVDDSSAQQSSANPDTPQAPSGAPSNSEANNAQSNAGPGEEIPFFTLRDRRVIRSCVEAHAGDFSPEMLKRPELPFGSEREIRRGGTLPADAQKKAQSLPLDCVQQLPKLPSDMDRVVYNGRVLLVNSKNQILDVFSLQDSNE